MSTAIANGSASLPCCTPAFVDYEARARAVIQVQLQRAGGRLAAVLNAVLNIPPSMAPAPAPAVAPVAEPPAPPTSTDTAEADNLALKPTIGGGAQAGAPAAKPCKPAGPAIGAAVIGWLIAAGLGVGLFAAKQPAKFNHALELAGIKQAAGGGGHPAAPLHDEEELVPRK